LWSQAQILRQNHLASSASSEDESDEEEEEDEELDLNFSVNNRDHHPWDADAMASLWYTAKIPC
jgi:hypothetical protein